MTNNKNKDDEKIISTTCASHCGGVCVLRAHVKNGRITRIETDNGEEPQLRACLRGRAYRQRVYHPERLQYPVLRTGDRGEGKFKRISWDEACGIVAEKLKYISGKYGAASTVFVQGAGDQNQIHNCRHFHKLLCRNGGYTSLWGVWSFEGAMSAAQVTYGDMFPSNARDDLLNSKLIILWGTNPANTYCGTNTPWYLAQAKEKGTRIIVVDPRYTDTAAVFSDEWIPVKPGTDAAVLIAMAYVLIKEKLYDDSFIKKYTTGFDKFSEYVLGIEDGIEKTPQWAERISGVPTEKIVKLAREYADSRPAALLAGIAPGRSAYGEQFHRAAITLSAMTGNVGIHGGDASASSWTSIAWYPYKMRFMMGRPEDGVNPLEEGLIDGFTQDFVSTRIHYARLADCILRGKSGGYPVDPRLLFIVNHNYLQQTPNINKIVKALKRVEFIAIIEQFMTATAKYADVILPSTTFMERNDIDYGTGIPFYGCVNKVIEPWGEAKNHLDIARELAKHMGMDKFGSEPDDVLVKAETVDTEITDYEKFRSKGLYKIPVKEPHVVFKEQIEKPDMHPFNTPSGKIEIFSENYAANNDNFTPPIAKYIETWEGPFDPLHKKYPLQMISTHFKRRTHGQFDNLPWLRELADQAVLINTEDAVRRNIRNGDMVKVYNDRGAISIIARVTERIMPGVVDIPQGAWYNPDENGVDSGGNPNVLIDDRPSPVGAYPYNTCLVEIVKL